MGTLYQSKWTANFPDSGMYDMAAVEWKRELSKIPADGILKAMEEVGSKYPDWPPSAANFALLASPSLEELGIPTAIEAWMCVCNPIGTTEPQRWKHPIVLAASRNVDVYNLKKKSLEQAMRYWKPVYQKYIDRLMAGETFSFSGHKQLEDKTRHAVTSEEKQASKETAEKHFAEIFNILKNVDKAVN